MATRAPACANPAAIAPAMTPPPPITTATSLSRENSPSAIFAWYLEKLRRHEGAGKKSLAADEPLMAGVAGQPES
jgi:hypothetical protein